MQIKMELKLETIQKAREIFLREYPSPRIKRTIDENEGLTPIERQILVKSDSMPIKYLNQKN